MAILLLTYSAFLHKQLLELFFKGWPLSFFPPCLVCSCWLFLDGYCLYLEVLVVSGLFWYAYIRIENKSWEKDKRLFPTLWVWKILCSRLPLKNKYGYQCLKGSGSANFLVNWVWSIMYNSKLEILHVEETHGLNSMSVTVILFQLKALKVETK